MMTEYLVAKDAVEQLARWDAGRPIWSVEMGGVGPGYEQAIQVLAIEIVRDELGKPLPPPSSPTNGWADATVKRVNDECGGFSGAQVGASKWLAYKWLSIGPAALQDVKEMADRHIQVSSFWPRAKKPEDF
jgi:hypothetical protein